MAEELDERSDLLRAQIASLGFRALSMTHSMAAAVRLAPTVVLKRALIAYASEELERFDSASMLYAQVVPGADLHEEVRDRLADIPAPESWLEVVVLQFLFDRAGRTILGELARSQDPGIRRLATEHLEGGKVHDVVGAEAGNALRNTLLGDPDLLPLGQSCFNRWLALSLRSFGRPGTERSQRAIELGLKPRDSAAVIREYLDSLAPIMLHCELRFPSRRELGLDLPDGLGLD